MGTYFHLPHRQSWTLILLSWALNGSLCVVVHQAQSGRITARTSFIGAEKELLACIKTGNELAATIFAHRDVAWKFNPPRAPRHDSSLERLVRRVKCVVYVIPGCRRVIEDVLGTTLCLVEQFFNSRPIAPVSTDSC